MKQRKMVTVLLISILAGFTLGACSNTFEGIGRDVEHAGEKIQDTF
ncbi:MAG: entericidin A/B family lipoprotein [Alphaproteobacteria bacterium]|nr:entericidin A/B family lipoprotein [Alphaproteobacteria bacterium]